VFRFLVSLQTTQQASEATQFDALYCSKNMLSHDVTICAMCTAKFL
jgi:hypothetical protein